MLSFDIRSLESHAVVVDAELPANDPIWEESDPRPETAVHVTGRLSAAGPGRFYWHGRIEGRVVLECNRCLEEAHADVTDEAHLIFAEAGAEETDDPDVYQLEPGAEEIDLRPALREEWLLAAPSFALCQETCKGLCPHCGTDLNDGSCDCAEESVDPRWDALKKLKTNNS
ncbi:MAG TPA: DUF177 domain-containing protein [Gemmatimonadaceae bacterium]|jgi:uncharacterized protein|nr:DUF177 domain-containing protein [Gemmatimonadaceae bacterium]